MVGCVAMVRLGSKILAIRDEKRGVIMPGSKYERADRSFGAAAERELREEAGVTPFGRRGLLWHGADDEGVYCYTYGFEVASPLPVRGPEGHEVLLATWDELLASEYGAYYHELRNALGA